VALDDAATPLLARHIAGASLVERLFALRVLGDDRPLRRTYLTGNPAWDRDRAVSPSRA
jgi:guanine deaminase